jgi:predicted nucleotidyltransferase
MPIDCESMSVVSGKGARWPTQAEELVARIRDAIREAAGSALAGLYLFGSLVVGDFDVDVSDIDLIAVLTSDPSDDLVARLGRMHDVLASENPVWAGRIEVIYVSAAALSRWWEGIARLAVISPGEPFHVVEGGPDWVLNWYPARESAITLFGPPVETFIPPISREAFESAVRQHMRRFPSRVRDGDSLPAQVYAILTMCRGWYTLCVGDQPSKVVAAAWAQRDFPEWAPLIRSALAWRKGGVSAGDSGASEVQRFLAEIARRLDV